MICNEIKCHVNTSLGLVGGDGTPASPRVSATVRKFKNKFQLEEEGNGILLFVGFYIQLQLKMVQNLLV